MFIPWSFTTKLFPHIEITHQSLEGHIAIVLGSLHIVREWFFLINTHWVAMFMTLNRKLLTHNSLGYYSLQQMHCGVGGAYSIECMPESVCMVMQVPFRNS